MSYLKSILEAIAKSFIRRKAVKAAVANFPQKPTEGSQSATSPSSLAEKHVAAPAIPHWDSAHKQMFSKVLRIQSNPNVRYYRTEKGEALEAKARANLHLDSAVLQPGQELILKDEYWESCSPRSGSTGSSLWPLESLKWHVTSFRPYPYLRVKELVEVFGYESYDSGDEPLTWKSPGFTYEWSCDGQTWTPGRERVEIEAVSDFYWIGLRDAK